MVRSPDCSRCRIAGARDRTSDPGRRPAQTLLAKQTVTVPAAAIPGADTSCRLHEPPVRYRDRRRVWDGAASPRHSPDRRDDLARHTRAPRRYWALESTAPGVAESASQSTGGRRFCSSGLRMTTTNFYSARSSAVIGVPLGARHTAAVHRRRFAIDLGLIDFHSPRRGRAARSRRDRLIGGVGHDRRRRQGDAGAGPPARFSSSDSRQRVAAPRPRPVRVRGNDGTRHAEAARDRPHAAISSRSLDDRQLRQGQGTARAEGQRQRPVGIADGQAADHAATQRRALLVLQRHAGSLRDAR